jgi:hypothetical protein
MNSRPSLRARHARLACAALALWSCARGEPPSVVAPPEPAKGAQAGPSGARLASGALPGRSDPACAGPFEAAQARLSLRAATGELKLGILAGLKDSDDDNLSHLRALTAQLVRRGANALVAAGDLGDNSDAQAALLGVLTSTGLPVLAVAGNRESRGELDAVEAELRKRGARLADLSHTRIVDLGDAVVVGLPGTFDKRQLRADGACAYVKRDVDAVAAALDRLAAGAAPSILVAAVPPRGDGPLALDVSEGHNVGDPHLVPLLSPKRAPFGIFGQVWEAGGRAVDGRGKPVPPGQLSDQLYLNPGAADRTPWPLSGGGTQAGSAALLTVRGRKAEVEFLHAEAEAPRPP